MKIALDLDGVIIDPHTIWFDRLGKKIGRKIKFSDVTEHNLEKCLNLSSETVLSTYTPDIYETCLPEEGAIEGVNELNKISELIIVSKTENSFDDIKRKWLKKYFPDIGFDIRYARKGEKKHIYLEDCEFFVDDFEQNFIDVKCHCLLFDKPWNQKTDLGIRSRGWREVIYNIKNLIN